MATYVLRRIIQSIPIIIGISLLIFLIVQLAPGSPVDRFRNPRISPEQLAALTRLYGLDKPLPQQYISWITAFFQVWRPDAWGFSYTDGQPVLKNVMDRVPATMLLMGAALIVTIIVSIPVGILAAVRQYSMTDKVITTFATIGYAMPSFLLAIYILYFGGVVLYQMTGWGFPLFGRQTLGGDGNPLDITYHLILPVISLAIASIAGFSPVHAREHARRAAPGLRPHGPGQGRGRSTGHRPARAPQRADPDRHAARALDPGPARRARPSPRPSSRGPGLGSLDDRCHRQERLPDRLAMAMLGGIFVILGNLIADILYGVVDPRIKY